MILHAVVMYGDVVAIVDGIIVGGNATGTKEYQCSDRVGSMKELVVYNGLVKT